MKKIILIALMTMLCFHCFSQNKKAHPNNKQKISIIDTNKFTGIGLFKIGCDTNVVKKVALKLNSMGVSITQMDDGETYYHTINANTTNSAINFDVPLFVYKIAKNESTQNLGNSAGDNNCPDIQLYYITEYMVGDIKIYNILLAFYKNKLIGFDSDTNDALQNAMRLKYGDGEVTSDKKTITCVYTLTGIKEDREDAAYYRTWNNGPIEAIDLVHKRYDDKCKVQYDTGFSYQTTNKEYNEWEEVHKDDYSKPKGDKSKLKDF